MATDRDLRTTGEIRTFTGRWVTPLDLMPDMIDVRDIAHSLSLQCRFNGHTKRFYSVAEHSVRVAQRFNTDRPLLRLTALLHDASETYLCDLPRPLKHHPSFGHYKLAEASAEKIITVALGGIWPHPPEIKQADNDVLAWEFDHVRDEDREHWWPEHAEDMFLQEYHDLVKRIGGEFAVMMPDEARAS